MDDFDEEFSSGGGLMPSFHSRRHYDARSDGEPTDFTPSAVDEGTELATAKLKLLEYDDTERVGGGAGGLLLFDSSGNEGKEEDTEGLFPLDDEDDIALRERYERDRQKGLLLKQEELLELQRVYSKALTKTFRSLKMMPEPNCGQLYMGEEEEDQEEEGGAEEEERQEDVVRAVVGSAPSRWAQERPSALHQRGRGVGAAGRSSRLKFVQRLRSHRATPQPSAPSPPMVRPPTTVSSMAASADTIPLELR